MPATSQRHHQIGPVSDPNPDQTPTANATSAGPPIEDAERFHRTQLRAHELWEQAAKPNDDGSQLQFWLEAEKSVAASCPSCG